MLAITIGKEITDLVLDSNQMLVSHIQVTPWLTYQESDRAAYTVLFIFPQTEGTASLSITTITPDLISVYLNVIFTVDCVFVHLTLPCNFLSPFLIISESLDSKKLRTIDLNFLYAVLMQMYDILETVSHIHHSLWWCMDTSVNVRLSPSQSLSTQLIEKKKLWSFLFSLNLMKNISCWAPEKWC